MAYPFSRERGVFWAGVSGRLPEKARKRGVFFVIANGNQSGGGGYTSIVDGGGDVPLDRV